MHKLFDSRSLALTSRIPGVSRACTSPLCIVEPGSQRRIPPPFDAGQGRSYNAPNLSFPVRDRFRGCDHRYIPRIVRSEPTPQAAVDRAAQDRFAVWSQQKWAAAHELGLFDDEIVPVEVPQRRGDPIVVDTESAPSIAPSVVA